MFKPYDNFNYKDKWFIKTNDKKLFPSGEALSKFTNSLEKENSDVVAIGYLLLVSGYFNGLENILTPKYENAVRHVEFLTSLATREYLTDTAVKDQNELDNLIALILSYVVSEWFYVDKIECIFPYSPRLLHPLKIVKIIGIENLLTAKETKDLVNNYIKNLNIEISLYKQLANKISFYGYNKDMLRELEPHASLNYKAVMDIFSYYLSKNDITGASKVLALYFPKTSIEKAIKTH